MTSSPPARPVPVLRGEERVYFDQARNGRLVYQVCTGCCRPVFYLRAVCPACGCPELTLEESRGHGVVYSFTTQYRAGHPSFAGDVPYTIVLVDLDEGIRVLADLVECEPDAVHVGMDVTVFFDDSGELTLPRFRPAAVREHR